MAIKQMHHVGVVVDDLDGDGEHTLRFSNDGSTAPF